MWIIFVAILFVLPIVFLHNRDLTQRHEKYANGIENHDSGYRDFVYKVHKSKGQILQALAAHTTFTFTKYRFDPAACTVEFYSDLPAGALDITYRLEISEYDGYCILKVIQHNRLWEKNNYRFLQNEFWHQLLDAVPVPYSQYA